MSTVVIEKHKRVQQSILAPLESKSLNFFARILPRWVNSDHLTVLGIVSMFLAGVAYALSQWNPMALHAVNVFIVLNWFGDSLDGTLARYRNKLRPRYGFYVDHILDNFGVLFVLVGLALSGLMSERVAALFLVAYFLVNINIYLATSAFGVFKISFGMFGPTELRLALIAGNLFLLNKPVVALFGEPYLLFDVGGVVAVAVLFAILVVTTIINTYKLYNLERV